MTDTIFPIHSIRHFINSTGRNVKDTECGIQWQEGPGIVSLNIKHLNLKISNGNTVSEEVVLSYSSPNIDAIGHDLTLINQLNRYVVQSSFIPHSGSSNSMLVSKVGIFEQDSPAAEKIYAPIIATEAAIIAWHSEMLLKGITKCDPMNSPLSYTNQLPPYEQVNFEDLKGLLESEGYFSSVGHLKVTSEFPWDAGAVSMSFRDEVAKKALLESGHNPQLIDLAGGRTALFQIFVSEHPLYGLGIMSWLKLPLSLDGNEAIELANSLNQWELMSPQLPPLFGAWSASNGTVVFASFLPTQLCMQISNVMLYILNWGKVRTYEVLTLLVSNETPH